MSILPHFKNVAFYQITSTTVFKFTETLARSRGIDKGKPLSTARNLIPFRAIWNDACDYYDPYLASTDLGRFRRNASRIHSPRFPGLISVYSFILVPKR